LRREIIARFPAALQNTGDIDLTAIRSAFDDDMTLALQAGKIGIIYVARSTHRDSGYYSWIMEHAFETWDRTGRFGWCRLVALEAIGGCPDFRILIPIPIPMPL